MINLQPGEDFRVQMQKFETEDLLRNFSSDFFTRVIPCAYDPETNTIHNYEDVIKTS